MTKHFWRLLGWRRLMLPGFEQWLNVWQKEYIGTKDINPDDLVKIFLCLARSYMSGKPVCHVLTCSVSLQLQILAGLSYTATEFYVHPIVFHDIKSVTQPIRLAVFSVSRRSHAWPGSDVLLAASIFVVNATGPWETLSSSLTVLLLLHGASQRWGGEHRRRMSLREQQQQSLRGREAGLSARELGKRHGWERKDLWQVGQRKG